LFRVYKSWYYLLVLSQALLVAARTLVQTALHILVVLDGDYLKRAQQVQRLEKYQQLM
jgi:hypothetical protein